MDNEETEICRVCRSEAAPDQPLFYPCRCSGSIKYVHEDCLKEWLLHSRKRHCELCKHPFAFTRVYRDDMPDAIPFPLFVRRAIGRLVGSILLALRIALVGIVWLIILPYATVWSLRGLFWSGENVALGLSGTRLPESVLRTREEERLARLANVTFDGPSGVWRALFQATIHGVLRNQSSNATEPLAGVSLHDSLAVEEHQLAIAVTRFFADCFEGQIIACLVVVVFVAGFLLREWILQNTLPPELQAPPEEAPALALAPPAVPVAGAPGDPAGLVHERRIAIPRPRIPRRVNAETVQDQPHPTSFARFGAPGASIRTRRKAKAKGARKGSAHPCASSKRSRRRRRVQLIESRDAVMLIYPSGYRKQDTQLGSNQNERVYVQIRRSPDDFTTDLSETRSQGKLPMGQHRRTSEQARLLVWAAHRGRFADEEYRYLDRTGVGYPSSVAHLSRCTLIEPGQAPLTSPWPRSQHTVVGKQWTARVRWSMSRLSPRRPRYIGRCPDCTRYHRLPLSDGTRRRGWEINLYPHDPKLCSPHGTLGHASDDAMVDRDASLSSGKLALDSSTAGHDAAAALSAEIIPNLDSIHGASASDAVETGPLPVAESTPMAAVSHETETDLEAEVPSTTGDNVMPEGPTLEDQMIQTADTPPPRIVDQAPGPEPVAVLAEREVPNVQRDDELEERLEEEAQGEDGLLAGFFRQMQFWVLERMDDEDDEDEPIDENDENAWVEMPLVDNNRAPANNVVNIPAVVNNVNVPDAPINANIGNPNGANGLDLDADLQANEMAGEEFDGVLEAMGIRGPIGLLFQNAALMALLVVLALASTAWMPYIVGKTFVLMSPTDYLTLPLRVLRYLTDPLVDLTLDVWLPFCWRVCMVVAQPVSWTIGFFVTIFIRMTNIVLAMLPEAMQPGTIAGHTVPALITDEHLLWVDAYIHHTMAMADNLVTSLLTTLSEHAAASSGVVEETLQEETLLAGATANFTFTVAGWLLGDPNHETIIRLQERWQAFAYGNTSADNFLSVAIGYIIIGIGLIMYLAYTRNAYGHAVGNAVQQGFLTAALVVKVIFFVIVELIVFPTTCGLLLDWATLPLFPQATVLTRIEFQLDAPFTSVFLHWFVGTGFMFFFSNFIVACRKIVRPGVMWFIRDPSDPQFHPMKEILERTAWTQLRKVSASALIYATIIVVGFGGVIYALDRCTTGIIPLRWALNKPISSFPIDLFVLHLVVPIVVTRARPKNRLASCFAVWWHFISRQLRLTSFMFGGRHFEEERTIFKRTPQGKVAARDGQLALAPSFDSIPVRNGRRMLIPVDEAGQPLDPNDHITFDPSTPLEHRGDIVYLPPYFRVRIAVFIFFIWLFGVAFGTSFTIGPLLLGRYLFERRLGRPVDHDAYAFFLGMLLLWLGIGLVELVLWMRSTAKRARQIRWKQLVRRVARYTLQISQIVLLCTMFGVVIPYLTSVAVRRCLLLPTHTPDTPYKATYLLLQDWALGILYVKIICHAALLFPGTPLGRVITQFLTGNVAHWNLQNAMYQLAIPAITYLGLIILLPDVSAYIVLHFFQVENEALANQVHRLAHPALLATLTIGAIIGYVRTTIYSWMDSIRDEEYLVGERLHNLNEPSAPLVNPHRATDEALDALGLHAVAEPADVFEPHVDEEDEEGYPKSLTTMLDELTASPVDSSSIPSSSSPTTHLAATTLPAADSIVTSDHTDPRPDDSTHHWLPKTLSPSDTESVVSDLVEESLDASNTVDTTPGSTLWPDAS